MSRLLDDNDNDDYNDNENDDDNDDDHAMTMTIKMMMKETTMTMAFTMTMTKRMMMTITIKMTMTIKMMTTLTMKTTTTMSMTMTTASSCRGPRPKFSSSPSPPPFCLPELIQTSIFAEKKRFLIRRFSRLADDQKGKVASSITSLLSLSTKYFFFHYFLIYLFLFAMGIDGDVFHLLFFTAYFSIASFFIRNRKGQILSNNFYCRSCWLHGPKYRRSCRLPCRLGCN